MKVISHAPSRISLFGGGTDIDPYAQTYGGVCLSMAINIRQHVILDDHAKSLHLTEDDDPHFLWKVVESMGFAKTTFGVKHRYDHSIEGGLGSSAAFAVALVGALNKISGKSATPAEVAHSAWDIEVNKLGLYGGRQDQYAAAYGGVNAMQFGREGVVVTPLSRGFLEPILPHFLLFHMGFNRQRHDIQKSFKKLESIQVKALDGIKALAVAAIDPLAQGDIAEVARLMKHSWELKKYSNKGVTNEDIDALYEKALSMGASAGKVLGAGGGGHFLFIVAPDKQKEFIKNMEKERMRHVDFSIDWTGLDTRIL
jgi:D-glycero-alpha-D-manno-heptose-7-phosphate kinase